MAGEIQFAYGTTGETVYAVVRDSAGQVWNTAASEFEVFNAGNWDDYDIPVLEQGDTGYYVGDFPSAEEGLYLLEVRKRAGVSPATSDNIVGAGSLSWDGSAATGGNAPSAAEVAVAVWNALKENHEAAGSFGEMATEIRQILEDTETLAAMAVKIDQILRNSRRIGLVPIIRPVG